MIYDTLEEFEERHFNAKKDWVENLTFEEFKKEARYRNITLVEHFNKQGAKNPDDIRVKDQDEVLRWIYEITVKRRKEVLWHYYNEHVAIKSQEEFDEKLCYKLKSIADVYAFPKIETPKVDADGNIIYLKDKLTGEPVFETQRNGDYLLDDDGNPIPQADVDIVYINPDGSEHTDLSNDNVMPKVGEVDNRYISGIANTSKSKIIKNWYGDYMWDTKKSASSSPTVLGATRGWLNELIIPANYAVPSSLRVMKRGDIRTLMSTLRGTHSNASVFNPHTAGWIIENILGADQKENKNKRLLTPVMGWTSYFVGFLNTPDWKEYKGIDVIPEVIDKSNDVRDYWNETIAPRLDSKVVDDWDAEPFSHKKEATFYCTPSQEMDAEHNFSAEHEEYFDGIFWSPPYFDLEEYESYKEEETQQSIESFSDYDEWLDGYFEPTVAMLSRVMAKTGRMTFVISDYKNKHGKIVPLSADMDRICRKYFEHEKTYKIRWTSMRTNPKMADGNFEDAHTYVSKNRPK